MAKTVWIKNSGLWKRVTSVWIKNSGIWTQINVDNGPLPFGINGTQSIGGASTFTVPSRIYRLSVTCNAGCIRGNYGIVAGRGGIVRAVFDVTPGEVFRIQVATGGGSRGSSGTSSGSGGNALAFGLDPGRNFNPGEVWLIAGAPGGQFFENPPGGSVFFGGDGGGNTGATANGSSGSVGGTGGGQSSGGTLNGAFLSGGDAGGSTTYGGGGGGGYYGGGGGAGPAQWGQGGGGGSSYGNIPSGRNGNYFDNTQAGGYFGGNNTPTNPSIYINY
jgi:hypothetical protein